MNTNVEGRLDFEMVSVKFVRADIAAKFAALLEAVLDRAFEGEL